MSSTLPGIIDRNTATAASATTSVPTRWSRLDIVLGLLLLLCIGRLWIQPLFSSLWVDEMVTVFVVHHGENHSSLGVAPQLRGSIYYWLPRASTAVFGESEAAWRLPSFLAMAAALFFITRIVARLINPSAAWFAVFACLALHGISYQAVDARPYAFGIFVSCASLWFLIRWLDSDRWIDAALFFVGAALLWRIQLVFWPFYLVYAVYVVARLMTRDTAVGWLRAIGVFALIGVALIPVLLEALPLMQQAKAHVISPLPYWRDIEHALSLRQIIACFGCAWVLGLFLRRQNVATRISVPSIMLFVCWWLLHPLALYMYSWLTGNSIFVDRYLSLALPGTALAATLIMALLIPPQYLKQVALVLGVGALLWFPFHHGSDWRGVSQKVNALHLPADTPIIYPSPFIEAKFPVWRPGYPLPSFLYAQTDLYPMKGQPYLFPYESSKDAAQDVADEYARQLTATTLSKRGRFVIYGGRRSTRYWIAFFRAQPQLAGWTTERLETFGDIEAILFTRP